MAHYLHSVELEELDLLVKIEDIEIESILDRAVSLNVGREVVDHEGSAHDNMQNPPSSLFMQKEESKQR